MLYSTPSASRQILTVTKLNRLARTILEGEIGLIWLSAEISNFVSAASGHWYFTLKDNKAQVRAAMFKNTNRHIRQRPKEGDKVLVRASVGLYEPRGDYQLIVEHLENDGEGKLKQEFEALKRKLQADGLFDADAKRPLPPTISRIGVVTSSSGAALHDVLTVLKRRSPSTEVVIYPTLVQGEQAPAQLIYALETAYRRNEVDVILLTRGGGSLEDLWCFNNEALAHCISASPVPVVSAVGHEIDVTIADFVADLRAPTPSAGAELLSQDKTARLKAVAQARQRLLRSWQQHHASQYHHWAVLQQRLRAVHPTNRLQSQSQTLDRLQLTLSHAMQNRLGKARQHHTQLDNRLYRFDPLNKLVRLQERQKSAEKALAGAMKRQLIACQQRLSSQAHVLASVSPLNTLARGYSITFKQDVPVTAISQLSSGDTIITQLADGTVTSEIKSVEGN